MHSAACVTAINDNIRTRGVTARIANQIDISPLQLFGIPWTVEGNHAVPQILSLLVDKV